MTSLIQAGVSIVVLIVVVFLVAEIWAATNKTNIPASVQTMVPLLLIILVVVFIIALLRTVE